MRSRIERAHLTAKRVPGTRGRRQPETPASTNARRKTCKTGGGSSPCARTRGADRNTVNDSITPIFVRSGSREIRACSWLNCSTFGVHYLVADCPKALLACSTCDVPAPPVRLPQASHRASVIRVLKRQAPVLVLAIAAACFAAGTAHSRPLSEREAGGGTAGAGADPDSSTRVSSERATSTMSASAKLQRIEHSLKINRIALRARAIEPARVAGSADAAARRHLHVT